MTTRSPVGSNVLCLPDRTGYNSLRKEGCPVPVTEIRRRVRWTGTLIAFLMGAQLAVAGAASADDVVAPPPPPSGDVVVPPTTGGITVTLDPLVSLDVSLFPEMDLVNWATVFAPWGDQRLYTLVAGGDAESSAGWRFTGGAFIGYGNEPWRVWGADDRRSAALLPGSSATLRTTDHFAAELRFFLQRLPGASASSWLKVTVTAQNTDGSTATVTHRVDGTSSWAASAPLPVPDVRGTAGVQYLTIRFEPVGWGTWRLDDVALDPWRAG